ncbi:MAG: biopolymer transporter ExbD [Bdellovibrionaceae bacterium]|nr:biopolymer transporter ExbD [Pseudobdellovibrionaceae bacterium]
MAAKAGGSSETISDINMVPLIDIILVVLIIFMVTAPALIKPSIEVDLPEAASGDETTPSLLNVAITAEGMVLLNNEEVDEDEAKLLAKEEFERNPEVQAIVVADQNLPYWQVIKVLDWIKSSGVKNFAVTTDKPVTH